MKFVDLIIFSQTTRIAILLTTCLAIGFIAPAIINVFLEFTPPNPFVAGTCHINAGMRANCFPEVDAKNQVLQYISLKFQIKPFNLLQYITIYNICKLFLAYSCSLCPCGYELFEKRMREPRLLLSGSGFRRRGTYLSPKNPLSSRREHYIYR